jgi:glycogen debranching enzyme
MPQIDLAYQRAVEALDACAKKTGFFASGLSGGYEATWARDSMITSLGASLVGNRFKLPFAKSLNLLKKWQTPKGQIPNCVGSYNLDRRSDKTYNTIDSTLWYIIGHYAYAKAYDNPGLIREHKQSIARALIWLKYQDPNEDSLLTQLPTMDWQDAFPHKYGHVINTQALYFAVLKLMGDDKLARRLRDNLNGKTWDYLTMYSAKLGYYLPWNWKNHDGDREQEEWFDSLGNVLAILSGLASKAIAERILAHIEKEKINEPWPLKAIWPPIKKGDKEWHSYFSKCDARTPLEYLNGGIWPFIGGFYVAALVKMNRQKDAETELEKLARANLMAINPAKMRHPRPVEGEFGFNEWHHGKTGKPLGEPLQSWTAGMYVYAFECVKQKKAIYSE